MDTPQDFIKFLARHFVSFGWRDATPGRTDKLHDGNGQPHCTSGFIISVQGNWFLITAGHILRDIEEARSRGQVLRDFEIDDAWGTGSRWSNPVPFFDFDETIPYHFRDDDIGADYGAILLRPYYQSLLRANGVRPISELAWDNVPAKCESYIMLGMPSAYTRVAATKPMCIQKSVVTVDVKECQPPPSVTASQLNFYGRIAKRIVDADDGRELPDLDGMSGGPIFGFIKDDEGANRYWVIALQSGWYEGSRIVHGCRVEPFGQFLNDTIERLKKTA